VVLNANARHVTEKVIMAARTAVPASDLFVSTDFGASKKIASELIDRGYDAVLTGGGDGTFVRCLSDLQAAAKQRGQKHLPALGVLRLGTGNCVADTFGVPSDATIDDVLGFTRTANERALELLSVCDQLTPFAGVGLDAQILEDHAAVGRGLDRLGLGFVRSGWVRYCLAVFTRSVPRFLLSPKVVVTAVNAGSPALKLDGAGRPLGKPIPAGEVLYRGPVSIAAASTIPYFGLGLRMFPFAGMHGRRFQLRVSNCETAEILSQVPALFKGTLRSPRIHDFMADRVTLYMDRESHVQIGGDIAGRHRMITLALAPRPVRIVG
jgi:diacylglycerol kinase family enzyme